MVARMHTGQTSVINARRPYALEMLGIRKHFPGVQALEGVDLKVATGEIHAVVGENGAGKSSLMKILTGAYPRDAGEIRIDGTAVDLETPQDARRLGISGVYQELSLVPELTVAENMFLGQQPLSRLRLIDRRARRDRATSLLAELGEGIDVDREVRDLSVGQRQMIEIAKAYVLRPKILILDEPTSALTEHEANALFGTIRRLQKQGITIVFISHRLADTLAIAETVTVLRDGHVVGTRAIAGLTSGQIVRMMVGRDVKDLFPKRTVPIGATVLEVRDLSSPGRFEHVSFHVRAGEVLGLAGLVGAGRTELARSVFGLDPHESGEILLDGKPVRIHGPRDAIRLGIGYTPEERKVDGLVMSLSVRENVTLGVLSRLARRGLISAALERAPVNKLIRRLDIRPADPERVVETLSGGNQQKVVVGRWVLVSPRVLFLDEPTRGIDVAAKAEIHHLIGDLVASGVAIVLISSELTEVLAASDRILVLREGRVTGEFGRAEASEETVMMAATGSHSVDL
jgi:ABC-type sugar transport system ATPase subunit